MKAIGIVGRQGAGKTLASEIGKAMGMKVIRMGDLVREEILKQGMKINMETISKYATMIRQKEGSQAIAKRTIKRLRELNIENVIIDGIRSWEEVKLFKKEFGDNFKLMAIIADQRIRYERVRSRKREDDASDMEIFIKKDELETSWGVEEAIKHADYIIENNGSLAEFKARVKKIFEEV
ncbi:MAG: AAA family ATPase [Methanocellales archaeon]